MSNSGHWLDCELQIDATGPSLVQVVDVFFGVL